MSELKDKTVKKVSKLTQQIIELAEADPEFSISIISGKYVKDGEDLLSLVGFAGDQTVVTDVLHSYMKNKIEEKDYAMVHEFFMMMNSIYEHLEENDLLDELNESLEEPTVHMLH